MAVSSREAMISKEFLLICLPSGCYAAARSVCCSSAVLEGRDLAAMPTVPGQSLRNGLCFGPVLPIQMNFRSYASGVEISSS